MVDLEKISHDIRCDVLRMYHIAGWGHIASALSCVDVLTAVYFDDDFNIDRDHVILSKGHGCAAQYACLSKLGLIERAELATFYQAGARLSGLASSKVPGISAPTGSLGMGLGFGIGQALAATRDSVKAHTYVIMGDGEIQEGSVWEAAMFAGNEKLESLTAIIDMNGLQASGKVDEIAPLKPLASKWQSFGWQTIEINGHNLTALQEALVTAREERSKPTVIVAQTVKGKGLSFVEDRADWHSRRPTDEEWSAACDEMGMTIEELSFI